MDEIWASIPGYEDYYQASSNGSIRSLPRVVRHSRGGMCLRTGRILAQFADSTGYLSVNLSKGGVSTSCSVHRLVALTFLPNPNNLPVVNHKDFNVTNNCVDNLEWCTQQHNVIHAIQGGHAPNISEAGRSRISQGCFEANRRPIRCINTSTTFDSLTQACNELHLSADTIIRSAKLHVPTRFGLQFEYISKEVI